MRYLSFIYIFLLFQTAFTQDITYPLGIGNRWSYSVEGIATKTVEITGDTIMSNGKQYRVLTGLDEKFQRFEDNKVFVYDPYSESERLQYDFTAAPGDTILTYPVGEDTADIVLLYVENTFTFGAWRQRWWFNYEMRRSTDSGWSNAITDSIGLDVHTASAGWFYLLGAEIDGRIYGIIDEVSPTGSLLPNTTHLYQNYPNPFNQSTIINYELPITNYVELSIFNLLGQKIETLVSRNQKAGFHTIDWDAGHLSSGVYYYMIKAGGWQDVKKMLLLR